MAAPPAVNVPPFATEDRVAMFRLLVRSLSGIAAVALFTKYRSHAVTAGLLAAIVGAVWLASHVALTFDQIESGWLQLFYGTCIVAAVVAAWLVIRRHLRGQSGAGRPASQPAPTRPPSRERLDALFRAHGLDGDGGEAVVTQGFERAGQGGLSIAVVGLSGVGKTMLSKALAAELSGRNVAARLVPIPALSTDPAANAERLEMAAGCDAIVFATDQDLRSYEMQAIDMLATYGRPIVLALTKADRLSPTERREVQAALVERTSRLVPPLEVVLTSADPSPVVALATNGAGETIEVERKRARDVGALAEILARAAKR
jgi:hypothetical protein